MSVTINTFKSFQKVGASPQNLVKHSEQIDDGEWSPSNVTVTANQENDLDGNATLDMLTTTNNLHNIRYIDNNNYVTVVAGHTYYWSFDVKRGTMTALKWCVYNTTTPGDIIAPTSYYSQTSSSVQRVHCAFTVPAGCSKVSVYFLRDSGASGTVYVGRAQVHENINAPYVTTTTTIVP